MCVWWRRNSITTPLSDEPGREGDINITDTRHKLVWLTSSDRLLIMTQAAMSNLRGFTSAKHLQCEPHVTTSSSWKVETTVHWLDTVTARHEVLSMVKVAMLSMNLKGTRHHPFVVLIMHVLPASAPGYHSSLRNVADKCRSNGKQAIKLIPSIIRLPAYDTNNGKLVPRMHKHHHRRCCRQNRTGRAHHTGRGSNTCRKPNAVTTAPTVPHM